MRRLFLRATGSSPLIIVGRRNFRRSFDHGNDTNADGSFSLADVSSLVAYDMQSMTFEFRQSEAVDMNYDF